MRYLAVISHSTDIQCITNSSDFVKVTAAKVCIYFCVSFSYIIHYKTQMSFGLVLAIFHDVLTSADICVIQ